MFPYTLPQVFCWDPLALNYYIAESNKHASPEITNQTGTFRCSRISAQYLLRPSNDLTPVWVIWNLSLWCVMYIKRPRVHSSILLVCFRWKYHRIQLHLKEAYNHLTYFGPINPRYTFLRGIKGWECATLIFKYRACRTAHLILSTSAFLPKYEESYQLHLPHCHISPLHSGPSSIACAEVVDLLWVTHNQRSKRLLSPFCYLPALQTVQRIVVCPLE